VQDDAETVADSKATVYKLVAEGKLPHVRIANHLRFVRSDVGR
jgi:excisionase family DNA binding protein